MYVGDGGNAPKWGLEISREQLVISIQPHTTPLHRTQRIPFDIAHCQNLSRQSSDIRVSGSQNGVNASSGQLVG